MRWSRPQIGKEKLLIFSISKIKRQKNHIIDLKNGVHLILGHNGRIWISSGTEKGPEEDVKRNLYF